MSDALMFHAVLQQFDDQPNIDPAQLPGVVQAALRTSFDSAKLAGVERVCLCFGSRGVPNYGAIGIAAAEFFSRELNVPTIAAAAMGTHGSDDAEKEIALLASRHGITPASLGVPIISTKETQVIGATAGRIDVHLFREACEPGTMLVPINRIKGHSHFTSAGWQGRRFIRGSGPFKMLAIGTSKGVGAREVHAKAKTFWTPPDIKNTETLGDAIEQVARFVIDHGVVLGGLGIVDNANYGTAHVAVVDSATHFEDEVPWLGKANSYMPDIPVVPHVLIIDEIGKDVSGTGAAPQVLRRWPDFRKIEGAPAVVAMLRLTEETHGSAFGIGWADVTTQACVESIDVDFTRDNTHGAGDPELGEPPEHRMATDRLAFEQAIALGAERTGLAEDQLVVLYIKNTGALRKLYLRAPESVVEQVRQGVSQVDAAQPLSFNAAQHVDRSVVWAA